MFLFLEKMSPEMISIMHSIANDIETFPVDNSHIESLAKKLKTSGFFTFSQDDRKPGTLVFNDYIGRLFESVLQEILFSISDKYGLDLDPLLKGQKIFTPSKTSSFMAIHSPFCPIGIEIWKHNQPFSSVPVMECDSLIKIRNSNKLGG